MGGSAEPKPFETPELKPFQHRYSVPEVERLLGLYETQHRDGRRHITFLDILSWANDPGGDNTYHAGLVARQDEDAWMAKRGPLTPDSTLACVHWDFLRAVSDLDDIRSMAIVALRVFDFTYEEIGQLLGMRRHTVAQKLRGRPIVDYNGHNVKDRQGRIVRHPDGIVHDLVRSMNRQPDSHREARDVRIVREEWRSENSHPRNSRNRGP